MPRVTESVALSHLFLGTVRSSLSDSPRNIARLEQGRSEPDQPARAYVEAIARDPAAMSTVADEPNDVRKAGVAVRDSRDVSIRGTTTGQVRAHAGRELAGVRLFNG